MGEPPGITREAIFRVFADTTGLTPADVHQVLTLFALQVTLEVWRNSRLEDAHHEGFIGDEDMLRANSFSDWQVREISRRWRDDYEISDLADVRFDEFEDLLTRLKEMLLDTGRLLPHALIVEDVLGDHVEEMLDHMEDQLDVYAFLANRSGVDAALCRAAIVGAVQCRDWWSGARWVETVESFHANLENPDHEWWSKPAVAEARERLVSRDDLADVLSALKLCPWVIDSATCRDVITCGISYAPVV